MVAFFVDSPTVSRWMVSLDAMGAGGPHVITATAGHMSITLNDVLFGDVWMCSGQSNMHFTVDHVSWLVYQLAIAIASSYSFL